MQKVKGMRVPRMRKVIRGLFMLVLCMFVLLNLHILVNFQPDLAEEGYRKLGVYPKNDKGHVQTGDEAKRSLLETGPSNNQSQFIIPPNFFKNNSEEVTSSDIDIANLTEIKRQILKVNAEQKIFNLYRFGLKLNQDSVVIVVQVHDRLEYLRILLESLREVKQIENSLLIISHDVYSESMNKLVREVDFCPVSMI